MLDYLHNIIICLLLTQHVFNFLNCLLPITVIVNTPTLESTKYTKLQLMPRISRKDKGHNINYTDQNKTVQENIQIYPISHQNLVKSIVSNIIIKIPYRLIILTTHRYQSPHSDLTMNRKCQDLRDIFLLIHFNLVKLVFMDQYEHFNGLHSTCNKE